MEDCIFCKIANGAVPSEKVFEDDTFYAFRDINPVAPVHILVVPKRHVMDTFDGSSHPGLMEGLMAVGAIVALQEKLEEGFRFVINTGENGGQTVHHLHLHVMGGRKMDWPPG